jgi:hypothetical protein
MNPQWFLAWVDETETSFTESHQVMAEDVYSIQIDHAEGSTAILTLVLKNPRIGLLNAGRKLWVWLSWSDGTNTYPVFFGRLVGIPENIFGELVSLIFIAKPLDFDQQKFDIAQTLKELPWFDPVFVDSRLWDDPDAIVETRSIRWNCTRGEDGASLAVSPSDILEGEDGIEVFIADQEVPNDSISLTITAPPLQQISVKASVTWDQTGLTDVELPIQLPSQINGFNESIYSDWPKPGAGLGGGWAAGKSTSAFDLFSAHNAHTATFQFNFQNKEKTHAVGDTMSVSHSKTFPIGPIGYSQKLTEHAQAGLIWPGGGYGTITTNWHTVFDGEGDNDDPDINIPYHYDNSTTNVVFWRIAPSLSITAEGGVIKRNESILYTMVADIQAVLSLPDPAPTKPSNPVETPGADVGKPIVGEAGTIAEAAPPIGDTSLASYFPTTRGLQSLENRLLWGRAQLRQGARVAQASWDCTFERALSLSCRKSARLVWDNMPGGQVEGKITSYQIFHNVNTGQRRGKLTIGATIGHNGTTTAVINTANDYIIDYITDQFVSSSDVIVSESSLSDFGYSVPVAETYTGAFPLRYEDVVLGVTVNGSIQGQLDALSGNGPRYYTSTALSIEQQEASIAAAEQAIQDWLQTVATSVHIELVPISGNGFETQYAIDVTPLKLPRTVDFEAASNL